MKRRTKAPKLDDGSRGPGWDLTIAMFIAGGCLMCVEIVAGLTIAPSFGSSVFVWGSVIGVFMGALSLGYALGGRLAEQERRTRLLSMLLFVSALLVLAVPWYGPGVCRKLAGLDVSPSPATLLPLVAALILYFAPAMLLGMISPVAVRSASKDLVMVGGVVGRLYAWNALGSVTGGLLTTFVFVAFFGTRSILTGCGLVLAAASAVLFVVTKKKSTLKQKVKRFSSTTRLKPVSGLFILVFTCGVVMMSFEVIAGAQIAPYFGSSVFVWGSVISVFLIAMTIGYRLGGKIVDRRPSMKRLAAIVIAAGFLTLLLPLVTPAVCQTIQAISFGEKKNIIRPLFAALLLFFWPTMLFAMVAPFSVRLATVKLDSVGGVAGRLYALSTLGNMAGVLLTTFIFIPLVGKNLVFEIGGMAALFSALFALALNNRNLGLQLPRMIPIVVTALAAALLVAPKPELVPLAEADETAADTYRGWTIIRMKAQTDFMTLRRLLDQAESAYHHIAVIDEKTPETGEQIMSDRGNRYEVRFTSSLGSRRKLKFDQFTQSSFMLDDSATSMRQPLESGSTYTDMLHLPLVLNFDIRDVLIVGGGGGVIPLIFKQAYPVSMDVVEIDAKVVEVAQKWFGLQQDERLRIHVTDGRRFIQNSRRLYDLIIVDVYTAGDRIPFHLTTREFLLDVRERLRPKGMVAINLISALKGSKSQLFWASLKTFQSVFGKDHVYVFPEAVSNPGALEVSRNIVLVATGPDHAKLDAKEIADLARKLIVEKQIPIPTIPRHAANMLTEKDLASLHQEAPILTDDYAPVDMMMVTLD